MTRKERLTAFMHTPDYKPLKFDELAIVLDVPKNELHLLAQLLDELVCAGEIAKNKKGRYGISTSAGLISGRFAAGRRGGGFVVPDDGSEDIFVGGGECMSAMNGDTVMVHVSKKAGAGKKREGEIQRIVKRAHQNVVGAFHAGKDGHFMLIADDPKLSESILLYKEGCAVLSEGDKILAKIVHYPKADAPAKAQFTEFLGPAGHAATDTTCIIRQFGIPEEFSAAAILQAEALDAEVLPNEIKGRRDFRGDNVITIDGEDAKDLDDAVFARRNPGGGYRLFVHIADVTHYVAENTAIDMEALERATSVYFPDRVVPMLPRQLSNGICSLNPHVDRLTLSVIMDIDTDGNVIDHEICEGVIRSAQRMTYTDVTALIERSDPQLAARYASILDDIVLMNELAALLRRRRTARGSIDFDFPEPKIILGEDGRVRDVMPYPIGVSNHMIEEFMLICNEVVAKHASEAALPFVYRVHEAPTGDKMSDLEKFLHNLDIPFPTAQGVTPMQMQNTLSKVKGTPIERVAGIVMLRAMMKAHYSPGNLGHFGLAADYYCHFTSPIRRYPDLAIHRVLKESLKKGFGTKRLAYLNAFVQTAAKHSSDMEIRATEAEREADKLKICEYMQQFTDHEFDAVIASVTEFGMFVGLPNTAEGLIALRHLDDDFYVYNKDSYTLTGERTKKRYALGDPIRVRLVRSDPALRQIDFVPADSQMDAAEFARVSSSVKLFDASEGFSAGRQDKRKKAGKKSAEKSDRQFYKPVRKNGGKKKKK